MPKTIMVDATKPRPKRKPRARTAKGREKQAARKVGYQAYLETETWQRLRQQVFERDGHACRACGYRQRLHCHHVTYARFGGDELLDDLVTVCELCHSVIHKLAKHNRGRALVDATWRVIKAGEKMRAAGSRR